MNGETGGYRVLFVCTGNTCRSAMAEGILKHEAAAAGLRNIGCGSAGIYAADGMPASGAAAAAAAEEGVDISAHRARQLTRGLLDGADLVLVMTGAHYGMVLDAGAAYVEKTYLLREYGQTSMPGRPDIADPAGGGMEVYRGSFREIRDEIRRIIPVLARAAGGPERS